MTNWKPTRGKWPWRKFLTAEERAAIDMMDKLREPIEEEMREWAKKYNRDRFLIVNRAIHRAKHAAFKGTA